MNLFSRHALRAAVAAAALLSLAFGLVGLAAGQSAASGSKPQARTDAAVPDMAGPAAKSAVGGRVVLKGKGYSIEAASPRSAGSATASVTDAPLETLHEPIVCRGQRVLHIDNRDLRFDGNAITAEDGCEIHITNSRISARGIAVRARNASVHIENSEIEGTRASIDATGGAQVYAETSTFTGAARRVGDASIHDLGNNTWH